MDSMFAGMSSMVDLDISDIDMKNVTDTSQMFSYMTNLETIYVDNVDLSKATNSEAMFEGSTKLVGGEGTVYDKDHIDVEYARIDQKITSNLPGYFTNRSEKGNVKKYPSDGSDPSVPVTYYNLYWDLDGGAWKNYVASSSYAYGVGVPNLPTKDNVEKVGYTFDKWTLDGNNVTSIASTQKGSITLKAVWVDAGPISYSDGDVRPDAYADLPARLISSNDDSFRIINYKGRDTIRPTSDWVNELSLGEFNGKIDDIKIGLDTTGLKLVQTINYRSPYRREVKYASGSTIDINIDGAHRSGVTTETPITTWDLIKDNNIKAEVWWDDTAKKYKINLIGSNDGNGHDGDWKLSVGGAEVPYEVIWDLSQVATSEAGTTTVVNIVSHGT